MNLTIETIVNIIPIQFYAGEPFYAAEPGTSIRNTQVTTQDSMSATKKVFYDTTLLENARDQHIYEQFTQKTRISKSGSAEWRKFNTFGNADKLTEGMIPEGKDFGMTKLEAPVSQYGMYTSLSDRLMAESYDDIMFAAAEEMGASMGNTQDTLTRDVFLTGTSVIYAPNGTAEITDRATLTAACKITCKLILQAATWLKKHKAPRIDGLYNIVIHPSVTYDLIQDEEWKEFHKYTDTDPWKKGYVGEIYGCRVLEANTAPVIKGGAGGIAVYPCLAFGANAVGTIAVEGEDFRMITKTPEQVGGPLEQFGTVGYKGVHGGRVLYQDRLIRLECASSYSDVDEAN